MSAIESMSPVDTGMLRFTTAGSVDDGKSTLIGRMLYDTKSLFEDQIPRSSRPASARRRLCRPCPVHRWLACRARARDHDRCGLSLLRHASRKFIIADTPGHNQYTRNMVTGASTAELAIVLIDARKGVQTQSKRHGFIATLLRIPHIVVAVNKMDLVDYSQQVFDDIREAFAGLRSRPGFPSRRRAADVGPAGRHGRRPRRPSVVVSRTHAAGSARERRSGPVCSAREIILPGPTGVQAGRQRRGRCARLRRAHRIRKHRGGRHRDGAASGQTSRVRCVRTFEGAIERAQAPQSVTVVLEDQLDISRGDVLAAAGAHPAVAREFEATLCWLATEPFNRSRRYLVKQGTRVVKALFGSPQFRVNVNTLLREPADTFVLNDIGRISVKTAQPVAFESYRHNRSAGSFIVIDESSNNTVAAGLIV